MTARMSAFGDVGRRIEAASADCDDVTASAASNTAQEHRNAFSHEFPLSSPTIR